MAKNAAKKALRHIRRRYAEGGAVDELDMQRQEGMDREQPVPVNPFIGKLTGIGGQYERYQTFPEHIARSAATLAPDVLSGKVASQPGLRREDYTDEPAPSGPTGGSTWLGKALGVAPFADQPNDTLIERTNDLSNLAVAGSMPFAQRGALGMAGGKLKQGKSQFDQLTPSTHNNLFDTLKDNPNLSEASYAAGANSLLETNKGNPFKIATSLYEIAMKTSPEVADGFALKLPSDVMHQVGQHLDQIAQRNGVDPWKGARDRAPPPEDIFEQKPWTDSDAAAWDLEHDVKALEKNWSEDWKPGDKIPDDEVPYRKTEYTDADMAEYEAQQSHQFEKEKAIASGGIDDPMLEAARLPEPPMAPGVKEKAEALGLNQPGYHGTKANFEYFMLPEEIPITTKNTWGQGEFRNPELGVHFGTLKSAHDRMSIPFDSENLGKMRHVYGDKYVDQTHSEVKVIPAMIGAKNPLRLPDLGTWSVNSMEYGLLKSGKFTANEIRDAMKVPMKGRPEHEVYTEQIKNMRKLIEDKGYDSVVYRNSVEDPGSDSFIIWHPNKARSFFAKFDPTQASSSHLAAGLAATSLFPLGLRNSLKDEGEEPEVQKKAGGGAVAGMTHPVRMKRGGMLNSTIPGRTDKIPVNVASGSYVLPADVPSALGEGNSMAGGAILKQMFTTGPLGMKPMKPGRPGTAGKFNWMQFPKQPRPHKADGGSVYETTLNPQQETAFARWKNQWAPKDSGEDYDLRGAFKSGLRPDPITGHWPDTFKKPNHPTFSNQSKYAKEAPEAAGVWEGDQFVRARGGSAEGDERVPIIAAGGEYIIHPEVVASLGGGSLTKGHQVLDRFVIDVRKNHIRTLRKLKPPKA